jgi:RNA polymerase sigma factor (sigma-70 family)
LRKQGDARLTDLARAGSEPAFEAIVARYRRSLVHYCASVVGEGDAEEAVQEALLKAHAALLRGDPVRRLSPWLHVIAHNTALSYLRARASRPQATRADYDWGATVDSSAEHREELGEVLDAVQSLPDRQRDAIVMRELEGRSYHEIAAHLGSSEGAVRQLLHRARRSVRERVAALLPLEPLARWALTGAGGDAGPGAALSGACVVGAKACAALLLPATIAVVAAAPAPRPKSSTVAKTRPARTAPYVYRAGDNRPSPGLARVVVDTGPTPWRASTPPVRDVRRFTAATRRGVTIAVPSERSHTTHPAPANGSHSSGEQPVATVARPASRTALQPGADVWTAPNSGHGNHAAPVGGAGPPSAWSNAAPFGEPSPVHAS